MQTITIQADKSLIDEIKALIKASGSKAIINGIIDEPRTKSFDEARAEIKETIESIKKGEMELLNPSEYESLMSEFFQGLERGY